MKVQVIFTTDQGQGKELKSKAIDTDGQNLEQFTDTIFKAMIESDLFQLETENNSFVIIPQRTLSNSLVEIIEIDK